MLFILVDTIQANTAQVIDAGENTPSSEQSARLENNQNGRLTLYYIHGILITKKRN